MSVQIEVLEYSSQNIVVSLGTEKLRLKIQQVDTEIAPLSSPLLAPRYFLEPLILEL